MENRSDKPGDPRAARSSLPLAAVTVAFVALAALFVRDSWGHPPAKQKIPMVDNRFLDTSPWRQTYRDLARAKADLSDYDCYGCHETKEPPTIRYDEHHKIVIPKEHADITMGHGSHDRNNLCFNCHNEQNLVMLQVRDRRDVGFDEIQLLCGSCHGPTYRDWEAGAHGRTSGYWDRSRGEYQRLSCANCHDPHAPKIPSREPAPGPHPLRVPSPETLTAHAAD
jgi:hypothetical protein